MKRLSKYLSVLLLCSCATSYRFAQDGVKMEKVDQYINLKENIRVWLFLDYDQDIIREGGVRVDQLYEQDAKILKASKTFRKRDKVLFTVKSNRSPSHYLLAVKHEKFRIDTSSYTSASHQNSIYYIKDFQIDNIAIRQAIIPYDKSALSLIYYTDQKDPGSRQFARLDYLAGINAFYLQHSEQQKSHWQVNECPGTKLVTYTLPLNRKLIDKYKSTCISLIAQHETSPSLTYFKVVNPDEKELTLKLCPAIYAVRYQNKRGDIFRTDTISIP